MIDSLRALHPRNHENPILSDLHNEIWRYEPDPSVQADVVVLAGDIDLGTECIDWARQAFFCPVLYVPGNHEYYGGHLSETREAIFTAAGGDFHVLEMTSIEIGGVRFLGATAWTDYSATGNRPLAEWDPRKGGSVFDNFKPAHCAASHEAIFRWQPEPRIFKEVSHVHPSS